MLVGICENPFVLKILLFIGKLVKICYLVIPIGLVIFFSFDFFKGIINQEEADKQIVFSLKKIINVVALFLVPTFVSIFMKFISNIEFLDINYKTCLANTSNITYYEEKYESLIKLEEEKRAEEIEKQLADYEYYKTLDRRKKMFVKYNEKKDNDGGNNTGGNTYNPDAVFTGQTYNLTDEQVQRLAAICYGEKGNNVKAVAAEATMMANIYEDRGNKNYSLYDWALLPVGDGGWYASSSRDSSNIAKVTDELFNAVKDVLVNGNRTLPLYIDDHDCLFCDDSTCSNGNRGDVCYLDTNGTIFSDESQLKDRYNSTIYIPNKTKVYTLSKLRNSVASERYFVFYTFVSDNSGPVGYTEKSYKRVNG